MPGNAFRAGTQIVESRCPSPGSVSHWRRSRSWRRAESASRGSNSRVSTKWPRWLTPKCSSNPSAVSAAPSGDARVVDEHVKRLAERQEVRRALPHAGQVGEVELEQPELVAAGLRGNDRGQRLLAFGLRPAGEMHPPAAPGQCHGGGITDPALPPVTRKVRPARSFIGATPSVQQTAGGGYPCSGRSPATSGNCRPSRTATRRGSRERRPGLIAERALGVQVTGDLGVVHRGGQGERVGHRQLPSPARTAGRLCTLRLRSDSLGKDKDVIGPARHIDRDVAELANVRPPVVLAR